MGYGIRFTGIKYTIRVYNMKLRYGIKECWKEIKVIVKEFKYNNILKWKDNFKLFDFFFYYSIKIIFDY